MFKDKSETMKQPVIIIEKCQVILADNDKKKSTKILGEYYYDLKKVYSSLKSLQWPGQGFKLVFGFAKIRHLKTLCMCAFMRWLS